MSGSSPGETSGDRSLRKALQPLVEESIRISIQRDPSVLAEALFPAIGAAVRKAVTAALASLVQSLNQTLDNSLSLRSLQWRIESLRSGRPFGEIVLARSLQYRVEQAFLIHRKTGILLRHEASVTLPEQDADMVSGMLRAIEDFVHDSFGEADSEGLDTIQVGDLHVWIQHGPSALLACVVRGIAPRQLELVFQRALERIHVAKSAELRAFQGQTDAFADCSADLRCCFLGQMTKDAKKSHAGVFLLASLLFLVLMAFGMWRWQVHARWSGYIELLRAEKGVVVVWSEVGWLGFRIHGMRDPAAADPSAQLARFGIDPKRVDAHWEPYLSLDPQFVARRRIAELAQAVNRHHVYFPLAKAALEPIALDSVAADLKELVELAKQSGRPIRIVIEGRADSTGPEGINVALARERARAVFDQLVARGIPAAKLAMETQLGIAADASFVVEAAP